MAGLGSALNAAQRSLSSFAGGLAVVQNNIANAATPGYARQRASLSPIVVPGGDAGGVELRRVETLRSNLLELQVFSTKHRQGRLDQLSNFYESVEPSFRLDGQGGVDRGLDSFFDAASALSAAPGDSNFRAAFRDAAKGTASSFRGAAADLDRRRADLDDSVRGSVRRVNSLLSEISDLEAQRGLGQGGEPNSAVDTRLHQSLDELSSLIGFDLLRQRDGTLSLSAGSTSLLTGVVARPLSVAIGPDSIRVLDADGIEVTAELQASGGSLGGALEARNEALPGLAGDLDKLAKRFADAVNEQLARGVDLNGDPGAAIFAYNQTAVSGSGRAAGLNGSATPAPSTVQVDFSGGVSGSINVALPGFLVGATAPTGVSTGDTVSLSFASADGETTSTITTVPLTGAESAADLAARINDQIALDPDLAGLVTVSDEGGRLKVVLAEVAGQGFRLEAQTSNPSFTVGLEAGGDLGSQSADELAAALNAQADADPGLSAAGVRFSVVGGELRLDGDVPFDFTVTDSDPSASGFASGLNGVSTSAGGGGAAGSLSTTGIGLSQIATASAQIPGGNQNINLIAALADAQLVEERTLSGFYSGVVGELGAAAAEAFSGRDAQIQITAAAENFRDRFSAVDVNEEAVALLQFEEGYSAMLRVISVLNGLSDEVLNLVR